MRKKLLTSTLIGALIVLAVIVAVATAGCGTASQASASGQPATGHAQGILKQAARLLGQTSPAAPATSTSAWPSTADASKLPAGDAGSPGPADHRVGHVRVQRGSARRPRPRSTPPSPARTIPVGLKAVDDKAWVQFMGQWYEVPADMMEQAADATGTTASKPDTAGDHAGADGRRRRSHHLAHRSEGGRRRHHRRHRRPIICRAPST